LIDTVSQYHNHIQWVWCIVSHTVSVVYSITYSECGI